MSDIDDVCVVTQPVSDASESHVRDLLRILGEITTVSLLTANLPADSSIRSCHEVVDIATVGTGTSIVTAAVRFVRNQLRMARVLWRREESIVLFFGAMSYLVPILAAKLSGKTVVLEPRGNVPLTLRLHWEQRVPRPIARLLAGLVWLLEEIGYQISDAIITYTPLMAGELGLDRFESKLYPNGGRYVDIETFYPRVPFEKRDQVIGFLGRLDEEKRVRDLAEVAKSLPDEITFVFAGDGELRGWLERELSAEVEAGSIEITGWIDHAEVPDVLSRFRLLILYSEPTEGLPTVILEALACGTPVLAPPVSGIPDVVHEGETGFLIRGNSNQNVSAKIEEIMKNDELRKISNSGQELIKKEFSFESAVMRYERIFRTLMRDI